MPARVDDKLLVWGDLEENTLAQARKAARLSIVEGHVALMPDAHIGIGATIGSVIPTENAVIPSAVGVDIGCGMVAVRTDVRQEQLPDDLKPLLRKIEHAVPAGVGKGHGRVTKATPAAPIEAARRPRRSSAPSRALPIAPETHRRRHPI